MKSEEQSSFLFTFFRTFADMKKKLSLLLIAIFMVMTAAAQKNLKNGDLLFNVTDTTSASDFAKSIVGSTKGVNMAQVCHVAIVCKEHNGWFVLEATSKHGVWMCPLESYLEDADKDADGNPLVFAGRVSGNVDIETSINNAKRFIGRKYDFTFDPSDDEMYCSELVQKSYVDKKGKLIFEPIPMSFHDDEGRILPYWIDYYLKRDLDVPEGEPGSNPGAISRNGRVRVFSLKLKVKR